MLQGVTALVFDQASSPSLFFFFYYFLIFLIILKSFVLVISQVRCRTLVLNNHDAKKEHKKTNLSHE